MRMTFVLLALAFLFQSCSPTLEKMIIGTWKMETVMDLQNDVSSQHNPSNDRWITFNKDYTFKSGGSPFGENTGKWTIDESSAELFLDSDAGEEDDSYWHIDVNQNDMEWKGIKSDFAQRFTIRHIRSKP